jgi:hypothetical protein
MEIVVGCRFLILGFSAKRNEELGTNTNGEGVRIVTTEPLVPRGIRGGRSEEGDLSGNQEIRNDEEEAWAP